MALLASANYDPATAVQKQTTTLSTMITIDTTNLRCAFTAPANGSVLVRLRQNISGATTNPTVLLGVMSGATVVSRQSPIGGIVGVASTATSAVQEALFTVTGLSGAYTWDSAYQPQVVAAGTNICYGGPNDSTANNAWGTTIFEVYDAPNLLGSVTYDPATASSASTAAVAAMAAISGTNIRITFTAPKSGNVMTRLRGVIHGATTFPNIMLGVLEGTTVRGRGRPIGALKTTALATSQMVVETQSVITGVTGTPVWDAAYSVDTAVAATSIKFGGPNNASGNNAFGHFLFEVWGV